MSKKKIAIIGGGFTGLYSAFIASDAGYQVELYETSKYPGGISKDLLHDVAKSLGWEVFDGKDLVSLPRYLFGFCKLLVFNVSMDLYDFVIIFSAVDTFFALNIRIHFCNFGMFFQ